MSFLSASFITLVVVGLALFFLFRQRDLALEMKLGGLLAIVLGACLVFSAMFYVCVEYIYNQGPDDWGVIGYARTGVVKKMETSWPKVRIVHYYQGLIDPAYELSYQLPDGKHGVVICRLDYRSGKFTSADVQPAK